ncbi:MAG: glycosyltransferase [Pseudomonadota bacterium]
MSETTDIVVEESMQFLNQRPLVTFALFTYNQERYVREAIEAAFSQDYHPLEIIISDDGSSDNTFKIIQEMAESYSGPHKVVVLQTDRNLGTLLHVARVAKISQGALLVLAAGDDISKPNRTRLCVDYWLRTGAWGLYSKFDYIDDNGDLLSQSEEMDQWSSIMDGLRQYVNKERDKVLLVHGATSVYDKKVFDALKLTDDDYILAEDGALSILINVLNKNVVKVDESLVLYRKSVTSLTNGVRKEIRLSKLMIEERSAERLAMSQANRCMFFLRLNERYKTFDELPMHEALLTRDIYRFLARGNWASMGYLKRASFIFSKKIKLEDLKWALPRFISVRAFLFIKMVIRNVNTTSPRFSVARGFRVRG